MIIMAVFFFAMKSLTNRKKSNNTHKKRLNQSLLKKIMITLPNLWNGYDQPSQDLIQNTKTAENEAKKVLMINAINNNAPVQVIESLGELKYYCKLCNLLTKNMPNMKDHLLYITENI